MLRISNFKNHRWVLTVYISYLLIYRSQAAPFEISKEKTEKMIKKRSKDLSILQYDVIFLPPDFLRKLRGFSKSFAYVGSVAKGNIG